MQMPKFSPTAMLRINLILGAFVALTNGSALLLTISGGRSHLGGQLGEVSLWAGAGLLLFVLSIIGIRRRDAVNSILEIQVLVAFALIGALAAWGISVALGTYRFESGYGWSVGFLSVLGLYCYVLYSNVTAIRGWAKGMRPFAIAFVVACVAVDIAAFSRVLQG